MPMATDLQKQRAKSSKRALPVLAEMPQRTSTRPPARKVAPSSASKFVLGKGLSGMKVHDMVTAGVPVDAARRLMNAYRLIDATEVLKVIGISERTLQRAVTTARPLDTNASDRAMRLAAVTAQAIE